MIYFDCKFKANMLFNKIMKIEFENSIRRLSFLYHLPDIKIAWINPWSCMTSTNSVSNYFFNNHWWYHKKSLLFLKGVYSMFEHKQTNKQTKKHKTKKTKKQKKKMDMQSLEKSPTWRRCKFWVNFEYIVFDYFADSTQ